MSDEMAARSEVALSPILLVEDNPDDVDLILDALRKNGIDNEVIIARDGQEALDILGLSESGESIDSHMTTLPAMVLLDLELPRVDGHEVLKRIRRSDRTVLMPVVMLTSSSADMDRVQAHVEGVNSYVEKPVESSRFYAAVGSLGLYWLGMGTASNR